MTDYPEPVISDGNFDYFNKNPEDYKSIVLKCIQEILKINSNLLSKTGKVYFKVEGQVLEKEENTKKIYYQLINLLEDLLLYAFDDKAEKDIKEQDEKLEKLYPKYLEIFIDRQVSTGRKYKARHEKIITNEDEVGRWCLEKIEQEKQECYRNKLRALLLLFKGRKNELSGKRTARMGMQTNQDD